MFQFELENKIRPIYSLQKFPKFAFELVRNDVSSAVGAALGNALLRDCSDLFKEPEMIDYITMDRMKLERQKKKLKLLPVII